MAKGLRGSARAKKEQNNVGRPRKEPFPAITERQDLPENLLREQLKPVDQPASGASIPSQKEPSKPSILETKAPIEASLEPSKEPEEYNFEFRIEPSIGSSHNVIIRRIEDNQEHELRFDGNNSRADAAAWIAKKTEELAAAKAKRAQEKAESEAVVTPIVTPSATIDLLPGQLSEVSEPTPREPVLPFFSTTIKNAISSVVHSPVWGWGGKPCDPNFKDETVYTARSDKSTLHVLPEFVQLVKDFLDGEEVESFRPSDEGLYIVSHPSARKARFWMAGSKAIMSRI